MLSDGVTNMDLSKLKTADLVPVVVLPDELREVDTTALNTSDKVLFQANEKFLNSDLNSDV